MPIPTRERLPRPVDISTLYKGAVCKNDLIVYQPGLIWKGFSRHGPRNVALRGSNLDGRGVRLSGVGSVEWPQLSGQENSPIGVIGVNNNGGRRRGINWPSWYPRRPLQDITVLVQAIETRKAELNRTIEAQQEENNTEAQHEEVNVETLEISIIELEQEMGTQTSLPTCTIPPKNTDDWEASFDFLTPQKRLLFSIEKVRDFWLEDQKRLARTPPAKKAEREKKVRTLMSMR